MLFRSAGHGGASPRFRGRTMGAHPPGELATPFEAELAEHIVDMGLHGGQADMEATRDLLVAEPGGDEAHHLVFPRCAAVVHHAGAGTTHTTLRAGVPSIPVPHVSDQFAWSEELQRLGVSPAPLRRTKLTATSLAARIQEVVTTPSMQTRAAAIAERMRPDNGPKTACDLIERAIERLPQGHRDTEPIT